MLSFAHLTRKETYDYWPAVTTLLKSRFSSDLTRLIRTYLHGFDLHKRRCPQGCENVLGLCRDLVLCIFRNYVRIWCINENLLGPRCSLLEMDKPSVMDRLSPRQVIRCHPQTGGKWSVTLCSILLNFHIEETFLFTEQVNAMSILDATHLLFQDGTESRVWNVPSRSIVARIASLLWQLPLVGRDATSYTMYNTDGSIAQKLPGSGKYNALASFFGGKAVLWALPTHLQHSYFVSSPNPNRMCVLTPGPLAVNFETLHTLWELSLDSGEIVHILRGLPLCGLVKYTRLLDDGQLMIFGGRTIVIDQNLQRWKLVCEGSECWHLAGDRVGVKDQSGQVVFLLE